MEALLCKCIIHQYLLIEFQVFISKENGGIRFEATSQQTKKSKKRNLTCLRAVNKIKLIIIDCSIPLLKAQEWIQKQFLYDLYWKACTVQKISSRIVRTTGWSIILLNAIPLTICAVNSTNCVLWAFVPLLIILCLCPVWGHRN